MIKGKNKWSVYNPSKNEWNLSYLFSHKKINSVPYPNQ